MAQEFQESHWLKQSFIKSKCSHSWMTSKKGLKWWKYFHLMWKYLKDAYSMWKYFHLSEKPEYKTPLMNIPSYKVLIFWINIQNIQNSYSFDNEQIIMTFISYNSRTKYFRVFYKIDASATQWKILHSSSWHCSHFPQGIVDLEITVEHLQRKSNGITFKHMRHIDTAQ